MSLCPFDFVIPVPVDADFPPPPLVWLPSTAYAEGDKVQNIANGGRLYVCVVAGTSGALPGPTLAAPGTVTEGSVTWEFVPPPAMDFFPVTVEMPTPPCLLDQF